MGYELAHICNNTPSRRPLPMDETPAGPGPGSLSAPPIPARQRQDSHPAIPQFVKSIGSKIMAGHHSSPGAASSSHMNVDYVIPFKFTSLNDRSQAEAQFQKLISALERVGLSTQARDGANGTVLVFVRVRSAQKLISEAYRSRVKDWLYGVRPAAPDRETQRSLGGEPLTEAERLRIIHAIITLPESEGGAGITPRQGQWSRVESVFPLHDRVWEKAWLKRWSTRYMVEPEELEKLRDMFGEKIAYYFAFVQSYVWFLTIAASIGAGAFFVLPQYSLVFAVANCLWAVVFVEYLKRQEVDLAVRWNVRNVSRVQHKRAQFKHEKEVEDPVTGESLKIFPAWRRLARQSLQIPFAVGATFVLTGLYAVVFAIEIFISEVYNGPFKNMLVFLPTVLLTALVPVFTGMLTGVARMLTEFENYDNESSYEAAMTQKQFVFNFLTSYVPLFLTAFVYVPFGNLIVPHLDVFGLTVQLTDDKTAVPPVFQTNPGRLRNQVIYFALTAPFVNLAMETVVPFFKRKAFRKGKELYNKRNGEGIYMNDDPREKPFLDRVRSEADLGVYDVTSDLREMCMQFGYLTMFSPVWPLTAVCFLFNGWIQLRSDAAKLCVEMKRPVPHRADSIGPWLDNLGFLTWMGSITTAALIYLFFSDASQPDKTPSALSIAGFLAAMFFSEHIYFGTRLLVRMALSKIESPGVEMERRERFLVRRRFLEESLRVDDEAEPQDTEGLNTSAGSEESDMFWRGRDAVETGLDIIRSLKKGQ